MRKVLLVVVGFVLGAAVGGGAALATGGDGDRDGAGVPAVEALGGAQAPSARLAVVVDGGLALGEFTVIRGKNVASVTNPELGTFCIRPKASAQIVAGAAVPIVSTEYEGTGGANYFANWDRSPNDCGRGTIEVETFDVDGVFQNNVGFSVVVP